MSRLRGASSAVGPVASIELEVPFHDVDANHIVWHGHYYKYLELARTALLRECNLDGPDPTGHRYGFVVIETRCRYTHPLRYAERAQVQAWFLDVDHRLNVGYEIQNLTAGRRSARAHTTLATLDHEGRLLLETPDAIRSRIA